MPYADMQAMQLHLDEMSRAVARGAHAVLLLDRAGWHTTGRVAVPQLNRAAGGRGSGPARLAGSIASVEKRALTASGAPRRA
jgi:hypothetical protein